MDYRKLHRAWNFTNNLSTVYELNKLLKQTENRLLHLKLSSCLDGTVKSVTRQYSPACHISL